MTAYLLHCGLLTSNLRVPLFYDIDRQGTYNILFCINIFGQFFSEQQSQPVLKILGIGLIDTFDATTG